MLLPVLNAERHLDEAMASLASQTFRDFEILAVDDGSDDGTPERLRSWAEADARVRVLGQPRSGLVAALERARAAARAPYVARMDADDVAHPDRFAEQVALLDAEPDMALCGTHVRYFPDHVVRDGARRYQGWLNGLRSADDLARDLFVECPLAHPTFMMRRRALDDVGGYRDMGWPEDYDLVLRLWEGGRRLGVVPRALLDWREGPDRHSRTAEAYSQDAFRRCKVHFLLRTHLRDTRPVVIWGAGPTGKAFGRALIEAGRPVSAWVDLDPRKIGQTIHGAPVHGPETVALPAAVLVLSAVGSRRGRIDVRKCLKDMGLKETENVVAVA